MQILFVKTQTTRYMRYNMKYKKKKTIYLGYYNNKCHYKIGFKYYLSINDKKF